MGRLLAARLGAGFLLEAQSSQVRTGTVLGGIRLMELSPFCINNQ